MKVITPGHLYQVANFEDPTKTQTIQFIHKEQPPTIVGEYTPPLHTVADGTTNEEILEVLIDRLNHLYGILPDEYSLKAKEACSDALSYLIMRTEERRARGVEGTHKP